MSRRLQTLFVKQTMNRSRSILEASKFDFQEFNSSNIQHIKPDVLFQLGTYLVVCRATKVHSLHSACSAKLVASGHVMQCWFVKQPPDAFVHRLCCSAFTMH